jgi:hypothetical protein
MPIFRVEINAPDTNIEYYIESNGVYGVLDALKDRLNDESNLDCVSIQVLPDTSEIIILDNSVPGMTIENRTDTLSSAYSSSTGKFAEGCPTDIRD